MKPIALLVLIALFLAACGMDTQLPMPTAASAPTQSPESTKTPEAPPTPSASPTETGPREGDTRMKEGVGEQVYEVIRDKEGNVMYEGWVRVKTPGDGIPMFDYISKEYYGYATLGNIQLGCSDRLEEGCAAVPKFTHIYKTPENMFDHDLSGLMDVKLYKRLNNGKMPTGEEMNKLLADHPNGFNINFFLTDPEHPLTWHMRSGPEESVVEILTDWDDPILEDGQEIYISTSLTLRAKILGVDSAGRLIGVVALNKLPPEGAEYDAWRSDVFKAVMFLHSSMVIQQEDLTNINDTPVLYDMLIASERKSFQGNPWVMMEPDN